MEITFNRLFKIDLSQKSVTLQVQLQDNVNLKKYVEDLIGNIADKETDKAFEFKDEKTQVRALINDILVKKEYDESCQSIAERLLDKELEAQIKIDRLGKEIQKGMLIISLVQMTDKARKLIISKADYDEFIEEITGKIRTGLPLRKKIYKAFIGEIDKSNQVSHISIYDTNQILASYWWKEFMELLTLRTDEDNTKRAFHSIETRILRPLEKKHKADFFNIWNSTIRYFRAKIEFNLDDYLENGIGDYEPFDEKLDIKEIKTKIRELPSKNDFDNRFTIVKKLIHKNLKTSVPLTEQIDLLIKQDVPENVISAYEEQDGTKYVKIKSKEGYEYFKKNGK
jgi:hypothetical protein